MDCTIRHQTALLAIFALVIALSLSGCAGLDPGEDAENATPMVDTTEVEVEGISGSCRPYFDWSPHEYHEGYLEWTPDGTQLVFNSRSQLRIGSAILVLRIADGEIRNLTPPIGDLFHFAELKRYGIHADLSPDDAQVVYTSCRYSSWGYEIAVIDLGTL